MDVFDEVVVRHHRLLAEWLGSRADRSVLAELSAAHTDDFTLVTVDGNVLGHTMLFAALEMIAGAEPGLRIEISDVVVVARFDNAVLVRFLETHVVREGKTARQTSALLRAAGDGWQWAYVHETAIRE